MENKNSKKCKDCGYCYMYHDGYAMCVIFEKWVEQDIAKTCKDYEYYGGSYE